MLATGKRPKRLGKDETETLQHNFWGKNYGHRNRVAQLLVITVANLRFLVNSLNLENGIWTKSGVRTPKAAQETRETLNRDITTDFLG